MPTTFPTAGQDRWTEPIDGRVRAGFLKQRAAEWTELKWPSTPAVELKEAWVSFTEISGRLFGLYGSAVLVAPASKGDSG